MIKKTDNSKKNNPMDFLKTFTNAKIALDKAGTSLKSKDILAFQLQHAKTIDAVYSELEYSNLYEQIKNINTFFKEYNDKNFEEVLNNTICLQSLCTNKKHYLQRPDLGSLLNIESKKILKKEIKEDNKYDLSIVICDGLSSKAIKNNAINYLKVLLENLVNTHSFKLAPLIIAQYARVAIADDISEIINTKAVLVLIGERPGLSSPDSLGLYLTYNAKNGTKNSSRNCISNIHKNGLSYEEAVKKTIYLLIQSREKQLTGILLKENSSYLENKLL